MWSAHLCLLIGHYISWAPALLQRLRDRVSIYLNDNISNGWFLGSWEKLSWVVELEARWRLEGIQNYTFSRVNALRKESSGADSQEETCLKFSQAAVNIKAILVKSHYLDTLTIKLLENILLDLDYFSYINSRCIYSVDKSKYSFLFFFRESR